MEIKVQQKKEIRKEILKKRRACPEEERAFRSSVITEKVTGHPWFQESASIYCYVDFDSEVKTRALIETALVMRKQVFVPKVQGSEMEFYPISALEQLKIGSFGILEPEAHLPVPVEKEGAAVLMIMPGVAFDCERNRIGYGGGYYDRYLKKHAGFRTIALAFECQITDRLPAEETDIRPECVITECRCF